MSCTPEGSPVLCVEAPFGQAVLLETIVLSILNHDSAVAAAASLIAQAAGDRPVIEMGSRRTDAEAAVAAARAAYIGGFASTSNLEAGRRYGVPTAGTVAHAFILLFGDERAAFAAQAEAFGADTTFLVDTYDMEEGIRRAVAAAGPGLGAIRVDSGDLGAEARRARELLDELDAVTTRVIVTGDLDERTIRALGRGPGGRLWGRYRGGDRAGQPDRWSDLQAGLHRRPSGGQAVARESHRRRKEVGVAGGAAGRGGGGHHPGTSTRGWPAAAVAGDVAGTAPGRLRIWSGPGPGISRYSGSYRREKRSGWCGSSSQIRDPDQWLSWPRPAYSDRSHSLMPPRMPAPVVDQGHLGRQVGGDPARSCRRRYSTNRRRSGPGRSRRRRAPVAATSWCRSLRRAASPSASL